MFIDYIKDNKLKKSIVDVYKKTSKHFVIEDLEDLPFRFAYMPDGKMVPRRGPYKGLGSVRPNRGRYSVAAHTKCRREDKMGKDGTIPKFGYHHARKWWKRFYNKRNRANFKQRGKHLGEYYGL